MVGNTGISLSGATQVLTCSVRQSVIFVAIFRRHSAGSGRHGSRASSSSSSGLVPDIDSRPESNGRNCASCQYSESHPMSVSLSVMRREEPFSTESSIKLETRTVSGLGCLRAGLSVLRCRHWTGVSSETGSSTASTGQPAAEKGT